VEIVGEIAVRFPFLVSEMEGKVRRFLEAEVWVSLRTIWPKMSVFEHFANLT